MTTATKRHPAIRCNAYERGEACGHTDQLVGLVATVERSVNGRVAYRWTGRVQWVGRWTADDAVAGVALVIDDGPGVAPGDRQHFGIDYRTVLVVNGERHTWTPGREDRTRTNA